jgi:hypothetical protein
MKLARQIVVAGFEWVNASGHGDDDPSLIDPAGDAANAFGSARRKRSGMQ